MKKAIGIALPLGRVVIFVGVAPRTRVIPYSKPSKRIQAVRREPIPA